MVGGASLRIVQTAGRETTPFAWHPTIGLQCASAAVSLVSVTTGSINYVDPTLSKSVPPVTNVARSIQAARHRIAFAIQKLANKAFVCAIVGGTWVFANRSLVVTWMVTAPMAIGAVKDHVLRSKLKETPVVVSWGGQSL